MDLVDLRTSAARLTPAPAGRRIPATPVPLEAGSKLGRYEILAPLAGPIDLAHPARTEGREDLVGPETRARGEWQ